MASNCLGDSPVSKPAGKSPYGVHDLGGNVWEWVADRYHAKWYTVSPKNNPKGPTQGKQRALRGGGFSYGTDLRASNRHGYDPEFAYDFVGFRCARTLTK